MRNTIKYFFIRLWYYQLWGGVKTFRIFFSSVPRYDGGDVLELGQGTRLMYLGNGRAYVIEPEPFMYSADAVNQLSKNDTEYSYSPATDSGTDDWIAGFLSEGTQHDDSSSDFDFGGGDSGGGGADGFWGDDD